MGRGSGEGYWWGHGVRVIVEESGESIGVGVGGDRWREKKLSSDEPPRSCHGGPV